ncbi:MAG: Nuclear envelope morphology protein 1 [Trizodia sp. TS-e1964]|nr:MAG: Nuclear envelope morphology protein 1 [Trizodia sp. TS-e1964]
MNALNLLSSRVTGSTSPNTPTQPRSSSFADLRDSSAGMPPKPRRNAQKDMQHGAGQAAPGQSPGDIDAQGPDLTSAAASSMPAIDEKTPLLERYRGMLPEATKPYGWRSVPTRVLHSLLESLKWIISTSQAYGRNLVACFYNERGHFSPLWPTRGLSQFLLRRKGGRHHEGIATGTALPRGSFEKIQEKSPQSNRPIIARRSLSVVSKSSMAITDSELETEPETSAQSKDDAGSAQDKGPNSRIAEEAAPQRRSIRIKLYSDDSVRQRKSRKPRTALAGGQGTAGSSSSDSPSALTPATLKSPTSPVSSLRLTRYPRAPAPPRPLVPARQPSYALSTQSPSRLSQKTLILDLDETLIHSMAKGGRMSTGHMVEVKLNAPVGVAGGNILGPQHPILYYVHKRPYCDDFLRKVCNWFNLVVFTASVQEYADPVIDWLEQERKVFSGRYYRQHCTFRNGAYIKDISAIEPDLSKVMILDNSPMSYIFHEDNAIPIEGWISDPTDNDLLHLVPLLEAMQYVTDVRALLALRMGEQQTQF